jgi:hypothetical protein
LRSFYAVVSGFFGSSCRSLCHQQLFGTFVFVVVKGIVFPVSAVILYSSDSVAVDIRFV